MILDDLENKCANPGKFYKIWMVIQLCEVLKKTWVGNQNSRDFGTFYFKYLYGFLSVTFFSLKYTFLQYGVLASKTNTDIQ